MHTGVVSAAGVGPRGSGRSGLLQLEAVDRALSPAAADTALWSCGLWLHQEHPVNVYVIRLYYLNLKLVAFYPKTNV